MDDSEDYFENERNSILKIIKFLENNYKKSKDLKEKSQILLDLKNKYISLRTYYKFFKKISKEELLSKLNEFLYKAISFAEKRIEILNKAKVVKSIYFEEFLSLANLYYDAFEENKDKIIENYRKNTKIKFFHYNFIPELDKVLINIDNAQKYIEKQIKSYRKSRDYENLTHYYEILGDLYIHLYVLSLKGPRDTIVMKLEEIMNNAFDSYKFANKIYNKIRIPGRGRISIRVENYNKEFNNFFPKSTVMDLNSKIDFLKTNFSYLLRDIIKIDPWSASAIIEADYEKLIKEFGIQKVSSVEREIMKENRFFRRNIIFGHIDLPIIIQAIRKKEVWAVMSGIKPSGPFHLGTLTTALEIIEFQKMGGFAYYSIADIESYEDNAIPYKEAEQYAIDNLADIMALGLDPSPERTYIWRQSEERIVKDVCFKVARLVTHNTLNAIYGEKPFGLYLAALIQVGDINLPQILNKPQPVLVPVGIDQCPHLRLARDLTRRYFKTFFLPGASYHKLLPGLDGTKKMSKRNPNSYFDFNEPLDSIKKKIMGVFTGGRESKELQKKLGGLPDICMIYKIEMYHFEEDDAKLEEIYKKCVSGQLMCGDHKKQCVEKVLKFIEAHRKKKEKLIDTAREILNIV